MFIGFCRKNSLVKPQMAFGWRIGTPDALLSDRTATSVTRQQLGGNIMRNWTKLAVIAVVGLALTAAPAMAGHGVRVRRHIHGHVHAPRAVWSHTYHAWHPHVRYAPVVHPPVRYAPVVHPRVYVPTRSYLYDNYHHYSHRSHRIHSGGIGIHTRGLGIHVSF